jgi:phenylpropionate dioxygenase-like ring-hydroxylating dioxygenase large terminal subunit
MTPATMTSKSAPRTAVGLPVSWYFDPDILEIERRELFAAGPTFAGHISQVPEDGHYAVQGGPHAGQVLVRHHGVVHLLSNICRHRQAELLTGTGQVKRIICPIHNWAYDLEGRQLAAPHFASNPCLELAKTDVTEWNGMFFSGPRDIGSELAPLDGWTELAARDVVLVRADDEEFDLNWKAFLEVYLEDYHIGVVHPGFRTFVDPAELKTALQTAAGDRFYCEQVNVRWPLPTPGSPLFAEYQKILVDVSHGRRPEYAAVWLCLFPGQLIEWYPYCLLVTSHTPVSPTRTRIRSEYYFDREIVEMRRDYVEAALAVLDEVTGEDLFAAETLQHGREFLYERGDDLQGPYQQPMEQGLQQFHDCLRRVVAASR